MLAFGRDDLVFVFNFNPVRSFQDYGFLVPAGKYSVILDSDGIAFGGYGRIDDSCEHFTLFDPLYCEQQKGWLKLYLPSRTALVLKKNNTDEKG